MTPRKIAGMRNREAARYARWSAGVALVICFVVLGVYLHRQVRDRGREKKFVSVPSTVSQQSAGFGFSRVVGARTIFTVRASQATEFKDQSRSLLENVDITIFGPHGDRNDSVHARECSYDPATSNIHCEGTVQIDLRGASSGAEVTGASQKNTLHLDTSDILFSQDRVTTNKPVALKFSNGYGKGVGLLYEPQTENATLESDVRLEISPPQTGNRAPISVSSRAMGFIRSENLLRFSGPVKVQRDSDTLAAGLLELQLDSAMQPVRVLATENPVLRASGARRKGVLAAGEIAAELMPDGKIKEITADGNVSGESSEAAGQDHFSAQHAQIVMASTSSGSAPHEILAQGKVSAETSQGARRGNLTTENLRIELSPEAKGGDRISRAETLSPGKLTMIEPNETDELEGNRLTAIFGAQSQLTELQGNSGVRVERRRDADSHETSAAETMVAKFGPDGNWQTINESGNVKFQQGEKSAAADAAQLSRATNEMVLKGSASVQDSSSRLQAAEIRMNQTTNEMHATGNVSASFTGTGGNSGSNQTLQGAQIASDEMDGSSLGQSSSANSSSKAGHAIFTGHARFWQGSDVLQAQTIEFWQGDNRAEARGSVLGAFVEAPHNNRSAEPANGNRPTTKTTPVLWQVRSPKVDYWSDSGKMKWTGGVKAQSSEGAIDGQTIEVYFSQKQTNQQTLERATATGNVRIEQNGRTGTAQQGEYLAQEGKFILSGGKPTLADSSGNTTTGRELTFFLANNSVLVDSRNDKANDR